MYKYNILRQSMEHLAIAMAHPIHSHVPVRSQHRLFPLVPEHIRQWGHF